MTFFFFLSKMEFYLKGKQIIENYAKREQYRESEILGCEKEFIFEYQGWKFRGKIDRFEKLPDGSYHVIDYKTDGKISDDFDVNVDVPEAYRAYTCVNA